MTKRIKTRAAIWEDGDKNAIKKLLIEVSLENFRITNDPICLAQIIPYLDFYGVPEAAEELTDYLVNKTRKTKKYTDKLWWQNVCIIYRRLKTQDKWEEASHEAIANHIYHSLGVEPIGKEPDQKFAEALRKQLSRNNHGKS